MSTLMNTYARLPVTFTHGKGALLFDDAGKSYLDGVSGIAVTNLGHAHPAVTEAVSEQASNLVHCSNLFRISAQERAADQLTSIAEMDRVFFCNSGAEANEAAIKLARLHGQRLAVEQSQIIVLEHAFHGRTLATLSASGSRKIQAGFEPLVSGFVRAPRNDIGAIETIGASNTGVVAVMLEPVQGEGGIHPLDVTYLAALKDLCRKQNWLLIFDEVQSGNGRTGSYFYWQQLGFKPDIVTTAKALGNGVPIGACLAQGQAAELFAPGHHGSTYGGNPLACAAASAVMDVICKGSMSEKAPALGRTVLDSFQSSFKHSSFIKEVRQAGLMIGIELQSACGELAERALQEGILINVTAGNTIRLLPPLVMEQQQAQELGERLALTVNAWLEESAPLQGAA
ncbi:MAG: aspartate aminotransferase family protein [Pseudomonadota bacterium]